MDHDFIRKRTGEFLKKDYYYAGREWPYKYVKKQVLIEPYLEDEKTHELRDYKFFCFNGIVRCFKIDFNRFSNHRANYYSTDLELLSIGEKACPPDPSAKIDFPNNVSQMIEFATVLSHSIPFVRVDFYETNGEVYFGEMTFYPASGFGCFTDISSDYMLGQWLNIK